jgi:hypothetical protein
MVILDTCDSPILSKSESAIDLDLQDFKEVNPISGAAH